MSNRSKAAGSGAPRRRRPGQIASALAALLATWTLASGDARAERIVLRSGEVIEGSIIDATRNTVIIQPSIGGMRQMRIQDIEEVRFDLAQGREVAGQFLSWADGVYQIREGDDIVRVSESGILGREPRQQAARQRPEGPASRPMVQQRVTAAAPPASAAEQAAAPAPERQNQSEAAADAANSAAADVESDAAAEGESQAASDAETAGAAESQAAGDAETAGDAESQTAGDGESRAVAAIENAAVGDQATLAVKASVDPPEPGARNMVFKIELSQPASETVVVIYGTVDGTAKAGKDYESQQGMVTLTPGVKTAEVRVPLIEGQPDGEKRFELVLMADPKVAEVVDRRVVATIKGAD